MVVFSVQVVFRGAPKHGYEPPTSQRSHSAVVGRTERYRSLNSRTLLRFLVPDPFWGLATAFSE